MGRTVDLTGIKARAASILIDLRAIGLKQITYAIDPTPKNLAYAARLRQEIISKYRRGALDIAEYFPHLKPATQGTFGELADQWLNISAPKLAETTLKEYRNSLARFRDAWGSKPLPDITQGDVIILLSSIAASPKTFNNLVSPLRAVFSLAHKLGKTTTDLSLCIEQRPKAQSDGPDPLTLAEIERVLEVAGDWRNYFEVALFTGLRPSEQIALQWSDVDLDEKTITIRTARVRGIDKGTKTSHIRTIRLPDRAHAALTRQRAASAFMDRVFVHPVSQIKFADTQPPSDAWKRLCKLAGVRGRDARQTRHTYATQMLLAGVKPAFISRQMGHTNSQMFFKTYSKWLDSDDDWREIDKLNVTISVTTSRKAL